MAQPRFRFLDSSAPALADEQFWRDADASDRLQSRFKANLFLRELCRSKAWDGAEEADPLACAARERSLLQSAFARGYRLFGPDLDQGPLANAS